MVLLTACQALFEASYLYYLVFEQHTEVGTVIIPVIQTENETENVRSHRISVCSSICAFKKNALG